MLSRRTGLILKSIVEQYIDRATPVPSHSVINNTELAVSSATIRNEMARLEQEGFISRHHMSAGCIPLDKAYRYYVETLGEVRLPESEQVMFNHVFHQVERELEEWLNLAARLLAQQAQNVAVVTKPRSEACQFKHLELVSLRDSLALMVLVLRGAIVRQQLLNFDWIILQPELTGIANKLNDNYEALTETQILAKTIVLSPVEKVVSDCVVGLMQAEENQEHEEPYLEGLHFTLNQPEFAHNREVVLNLIEMLEERRLASIIPLESPVRKVRVIIGRENRAEPIQNYSLVMGQYGLRGATGTVGVIGPTRMPYGRVIATVEYLSSLLSELVAKLYEREIPDLDVEEDY